jgi:hypothetical protein
LKNIILWTIRKKIRLLDLILKLNKFDARKIGTKSAPSETGNLPIIRKTGRLKEINARDIA